MDPTLAKIIVLPAILIFGGILLLVILPHKWQEQSEKGESSCLLNLLVVVCFGGLCAVFTFVMWRFS
jgi:heme/copper-type cytochrome/quinol oxidase subunit 2